MNDRDLSADYPVRRITREAFESELIAIRNGANAHILEHATRRAKRAEPSSDAVAHDVRAVWHAAEVALAILLPGVYVPKREAVADVRQMLAWYDGDDDAWKRVD